MRRRHSFLALLLGFGLAALAVAPTGAADSADATPADTPIAAKPAAATPIETNNFAHIVVPSSTSVKTAVVLGPNNGSNPCRDQCARSDPAHRCAWKTR